MQSTHRIGAIAALAFTTAIAARSHPLAAQALPGWSYTTNMIVDSGGPQRTTSMAMRQRVTDRYLRTEFLNVSGFKFPGSPEGTYTIYDTRDTTVTMVMSTNQMATVMATPKLPNLPHPQIESHTDSPAQVEDLGASEPLLGHPTHHYRTTTHTSTSVTVGDEVCTRRIDAVSDSWFAPDVDIRPAADAVMKHFAAAGLATPDHDDSATPSEGKRGTPLRTITQTTYTDASGAIRTIKSTFEYVEISNAPIDQSVFSVPSDYKVMDMRPMLAKLEAEGKLPTGLADSTSAKLNETLTKAFCR